MTDSQTICVDDDESVSDETTEDFEIAPEKVIAPFLKTLKKRRKVRADYLEDEHQEFYLKNNPYELLEKLEKSFSDPVKLNTILNETAELLRLATESKSVNLYLTDYEQNIIILCPRFLRGNGRFVVQYDIEPGSTLAAYVAHVKEFVVTDDILGDPRFPGGIPGTDMTIMAAMGIPVISNADNSCIAVIELYRDYKQTNYNPVNLQVCSALCGWIGVGVQQNSVRTALLRDIEIHRYLVSTSKLYFQQIISFNKVLSDLVIFSKTALKGERCSFFYFDDAVPFGTEEDLYADLYEEACELKMGLAVYKLKKKVRFNFLEPGIASYVARNAISISLVDAYKDSRFDQSFDSPDFRTRSLIAVPVKTFGGVVGVLKLVNKQNGQEFTQEDVRILELFADYAAMLCEYESLLRRNVHEDLKLAIARELLFLHTKPPVSELEAIRAQPVLNTQQMPPAFFKFDWNMALYEDDITKYIVYVFLGAELFQSHFELNNVTAFALSVQKSYRNLPYHNFDHAFSSFHFLFNVIRRHEKIFSFGEAVALLIAGLCHHLDHKGFTCSFLELKNDPITQLYDEYPLEEHHFQMCLLLIQANNLLQAFTAEEYNEITNDIHRLILSTNLHFFFRSKAEMVNLINEEKFDWENQRHRKLMKGFLMVCSEFADHFKTFDLVRRNVENLHRELYNQGDLEKSMGLAPMAMMDRSQHSFLPDFHICFTNILILPTVEIVVHLFPNCPELLTLCKDGLEKWKELIALRGVEVWKPEESSMREKKQRGHRGTVGSTYSSGKSVVSDLKSQKLE